MIPRLRAEHPNEPWLWREDWVRREVRQSYEIGGWCLWGFTLVWCLFCLPLLLFVRWEWPPDRQSLVVGVFPVAGVLLLALSIHQALRRRRYGTSVCRIERVPVPLGATLRGEIGVRLHEVPPAGFALRLACVRRRVTGSGKNRSVHESILWQDEQTVMHGVMPSSHGLRVPFRFDIPWDCEPASFADPSDIVLWRLGASAEVPGVDYQAFFELPVFRTGDARDELPPRVHGVDGWQPPPSIEVQGDTIVIRPARTFGDWIGFLIFFPMWFGVLALAGTFGAPLLVLAFFAAIAVVVALVVLDFLLGRTTLRADRKALTIHRTHLGIGRPRSIPASEIVRIEPFVGATFGSRGYHNVRAVLRDGSTRTIARNIANRRDAQGVGERVGRALGV